MLYTWEEAVPTRDAIYKTSLQAQNPSLLAWEAYRDPQSQVGCNHFRAPLVLYDAYSGMTALEICNVAPP